MCAKKHLTTRFSIFLLILNLFFCSLTAVLKDIKQALKDPDTLITILTKYKEEKQRRRKLEKKTEVLQQQLDESKNWYTIKRVAAINHMDWRDLSWRALKHQSIVMGKQIQKIFDANFGEGNSYTSNKWRNIKALNVLKSVRMPILCLFIFLCLKTTKDTS